MAKGTPHKALQTSHFSPSLPPRLTPSLPHFSTDNTNPSIAGISSPLTDSNRRPPPYHGEAWRSLKVVDPGQAVSADRTSSAGVGVVAALLCCTCCPRPTHLAHSSLAR